MDWDDVKPKPARTISVGDDLATLSVADLEARLAAFQGEIERLKTEIARRKSHSSAAEGLFKR